MLPLLGAVNIFSFPRVTSTGRLAARGGGEGIRQGALVRGNGG